MEICDENNLKDLTKTMGNVESNSFLRQDRCQKAEDYISKEEEGDKCHEDEEHLGSRFSPVTSIGKNMLVYEDGFNSLLKERQENTKVSFNVRGKHMGVVSESSNHFNRKLNDENESKYLNAMNNDIHECPISIVMSFDYPQNAHQGSNDCENERCEGLSQFYNDLVKESDSNIRLGYNDVRQLPDIGNQGLQEKQTELHAHKANNNQANIARNEHITDDDTFEGGKQPGKAKNLIHDYELQEKENTIDAKKEKQRMRKDHLGNILKEDNLQSTYSKCNSNTASNKSRRNYISTLTSKQTPLTEHSKYPMSVRDLTSEDVLNISSKTRSNIVSRHARTKENNVINLLEKQPRIVGGDNIQLGTGNSVSRSTTLVNNVNKSNKENTIFIHNTYSDKQSSNVRKITEYTPKPGDNHPGIVNTNYQHSLHEARELTAGYQSTVTGSPLITRAHWYEIHNKSQKALHQISPPILKHDNTVTPPKSENIFVSPLTKKDNPTLASLTAMHNTKTKNKFHEMRLKKWKSLGELDKVEEYKLPEKLSKAIGYSINEKADFNTDVATANSRAIPRNHEFTFVRRNKTIQNTQTLHSGDTIETRQFHAKPSLTINKNHFPSHSERRNATYDSHRTQVINAKEVKQYPSPTIKKYTPNMGKTIYAQMVYSGHDNNDTETISPHCNTTHQNTLLAKCAPCNTNIKNVNTCYDIKSTETMSPHHQTENQSPSIMKYVPTMAVDSNNSGYISNGDKRSSYEAIPSNHCSLGSKKTGNQRKSIGNYPESKVVNNSLTSSLNKLDEFDQNSTKQSPSVTRRRERSFRRVQDVNSYSDSVLHNQLSSEDLKSNLSSSLTHLQTFDQPPMKRSQKIKNLMNIEYYDINSDEELHNKIGRRPRTKTLNAGGKTMEHIATKKAFKSTGDLRSIGLSEKDLIFDRTANENMRSLDLISVSPSRAHSNPNASHSQTHDQDKTQDYERNRTVGISFYYEDGVENNTLKSGAKRYTQKSYNCAKYKPSTKDRALKSIVYPTAGITAKEGKYNIGKAEEEWRKKYRRLPYNNKDPLHSSSDKEFGRLFQHSDGRIKGKNGSQKSSKNTAMDSCQLTDIFSTTLNHLSSYVLSDNCQLTDKFSTTLNHLSSYVLSGYKVDHPQFSLPNKRKHTEESTPVRYKRYHLDSEGDLSHILDDSKESPKLSMLIHAIVRLRAVYTVQHYNKPQPPEHAANMGNSQLRDAIQNKPMSIVKDLILANKSADINIRSQSGNSALHRAATAGDVDAIRILINQGADVNIRDRHGYQPVHQALRSHHYKAAMFLMDGGTDLMSYTSKRINEFVNVKAIAMQYLKQTLKTPL